MTLGNILKFVSPYLVAIFTAIVSVLLTLKFQSIKKKINLLRALEEEIDYNKSKLKENLINLINNLEAKGEGKKTIKPLEKYRIYSYNNLLNSGLVVNLSNELQKALYEIYSDFENLTFLRSQRANLREGTSFFTPNPDRAFLDLVLIWMILGYISKNSLEEEKLDSLNHFLENYEDYFEEKEKEKEKVMMENLGQIIEKKIKTKLKQEEYLFSLIYDNYEDCLNAGGIEPKLKDAFVDEDYDLRQNAELSEEADKWVISENGNKEYIIEKDEEELNIYQEENGPYDFKNLKELIDDEINCNIIHKLINKII